MIAKKITLYSAICDSRFVQIFGFVILGWGLQAPRGGSWPQKKIRLINGLDPGMKKPDPLPFLFPSILGKGKVMIF